MQSQAPECLARLLMHLAWIRGSRAPVGPARVWVCSVSGGQGVPEIRTAQQPAGWVHESPATAVEQGPGGVAVHWLSRQGHSVSGTQGFLSSHKCACGSHTESQGLPCWVQVWALQTFGVCAWVFLLCSAVHGAIAVGTVMELSTSNSGGYLNSRGHLNWC